MLTHDISLPTGWMNYLPRAGTPEGDRARDAFIGNVLDVIGHNSPLFWLPSITDTTTSTTVDRNARTVTWDATIASRVSELGSGVKVTFNGSSNYGSIADAAGLTFGDGATDQAFSITALVNQTASAAVKQIITKMDTTTGNTKREWEFTLTDAEKVQCDGIDESAGAQVGRAYGTALSTGSWLMLTMTYDGTRANSGFKIYSADSQIDNADNSANSYTAMEDTAATVLIGARTGTDGAGSNFFQGSMATIFIARGKVLSIDELTTLKHFINSYHDLSL